jgi:hypothetical protein
MIAVAWARGAVRAVGQRKLCFERADFVAQRAVVGEQTA